MLTLNSGPKFFILNALRGLSMISLLFVFIANIVIMAQDIQAIQHGVTDTDHEECDYIESVCAQCWAHPSGRYIKLTSIP
jgi:hypothetical protein